MLPVIPRGLPRGAFIFRSRLFAIARDWQSRSNRPRRATILIANRHIFRRHVIQAYTLTGIGQRYNIIVADHEHFLCTGFLCRQPVCRGHYIEI